MAMVTEMATDLAMDLVGVLVLTPAMRRESRGQLAEARERGGIAHLVSDYFEWRRDRFSSTVHVSCGLPPHGERLCLSGPA